VLDGEGIATRKHDGTCVCIIGGKLYARFDYKPGRKLSENAIPCQEKGDDITGHFPHWVLVEEQPAYKWQKQALENTLKGSFVSLDDGTYECIGPHFNCNPENMEEDILILHGKHVLEVPRTFDGIKEYLSSHRLEGIVFHHRDGRMCKVKRTDFGFEWNGRGSSR
jgi:hypothetical protein